MYEAFSEVSKTESFIDFEPEEYSGFLLQGGAGGAPPKRLLPP